VEGSQQAIRLVAQGRSRARGSLPRWIERATDFDVRVEAGSTVLVVESPTLREADPSEFDQESLFPEIDPDRTSFDYLAQAFEAALSDEDHTERFDSGLLDTFVQLDVVFDRGIEEVVFHPRNGAVTRPPRVRHSEIRRFRDIAHRIPRPRHVRTAGKLDSIRHSDSTFSLALEDGGEVIKGVAGRGDLGALQALWGEPVVVSGQAHFTASGKIQRIDADAIGRASDRDLTAWSLRPEPLESTGADAGRLRVAQGPRSGLNAVLGAWPGDESEAELVAAIREMS